MMRAIRSRRASSSSSVRNRRRNASQRSLPCAAHQGGELARVFGVRLQRVDGGIEARLRSLDVECPEGFRVALGVRRDGLRKISRRRTDGTDDRHRADTAAKRLDERRPLVEVGEPRRQVRRVTALAGQFAEAPGHLAQRLGPARGRIRHQRDVQSLVAEIFGDGRRPNRSTLRARRPACSTCWR